MRCLSSWTAGDGNTYNLGVINDFSVIPSSIINSTSIRSEKIGSEHQSSLPSYITSEGDLIFDLQRSIDADVTLEFVHDDKIKGLFGRYNHSSGGNRISGDQWTDLVNSNTFKQGGWASFGNGKIRYYLAVVFDEENGRCYAFQMEYLYYHWGGRSGWTIYVMGGKPNDVDLLFQSFGGQIIEKPQSAGGGGFYGGYKSSVDY